MRTYFLAVLVAVPSGSAVLADPVNRPKLDHANPLDQLLPAKSAAGQTIAAVMG